jgi:hypothetical protein
MFSRKIAALISLLTILSGDYAFAGMDQCMNPGIAPINSHPHGLSYSQWAAAWWTWALQTPASINPLLDTTGADIAVNQTDHVWFLAGSLSQSGKPVVRTGTIPAGTALFFPLTNFFYGAFTTDPESTKTDSAMRSQVTCIKGAGLSVTIDGKPVRCPNQYLEFSTFFKVQLPVDNIFGVTAAEVPELKLEPVVDEGYYLFLPPLPPGRHTIHWVVTPLGSCAYPNDITYNLTVRR